VLAAIWDVDAQHMAEVEQRRAARAAKVVPLRPATDGGLPKSGDLPGA
jgi:hypothetical protein